MPLHNPSHSYSGPEKVKYLFIDGGCLDSLLVNLSEGLFEGTAIEIDYRLLADGYQKVFYYDCLPAQKPHESEADYQERIKPKIQLFNHLKSLNGFHVYEGTARHRNKRRGQEQKQVDIMIAVDMLIHSVRRNMHEATLLTGDLDFKPLIDALVQEGMHISLWYPKGKANHELVDAADSREALTIDSIRRWCPHDFNQIVLDALLPYVMPGEPFDSGLSLDKIDKIEQITEEGFLYEKEGRYFALFPRLNQPLLYEHSNLKQLRFYIEHRYSPDVLR